MEGIEILSITDLVKKAAVRWKEQTEKRKAHEAHLKEVLDNAIVEESGLHKKIIAEKKVVNSLQQEYFELEKLAEKSATKTVEKTELTADKVQSGEITLRQFQSRGISEKKKKDLIVEKILKELEYSLNLIRLKRKKILQKELKLAKLQRKVFRLSLFPGQVLSDALKDQKLFVDREMTALYEDVARSDSNTKLLEHQLHLTEGKALSAGNRWDRLTVKKARKILFDPIIPESLIVDLKQQLPQFQDPTELINVILHSPPGRESSIEVNPSAGYGAKKQLVQTGKKNKSDKNKSIQTSDL